MHETELDIIRQHKNELERRLETEFELQLDEIKRLEEKLKINFTRLKADNVRYYMDQLGSIKSCDKPITIDQDSVELVVTNVQLAFSH